MTENLFGDILSDEAAAIAGLPRPAASASLGARRTRTGRFGLYEPVHGSAPQIAGQGVANPLGDRRHRPRMLLRWSLGETEAADVLEGAVERRHRRHGPRDRRTSAARTAPRAVAALPARRGSRERAGGAGVTAPIILYDTTLRDGTQREGLVLSAWPTS